MQESIALIKHFHGSLSWFLNLEPVLQIFPTNPSLFSKSYVSHRTDGLIKNKYEDRT